MTEKDAPVVSGNRGVSDDHLAAAMVNGSIAYAAPVVQFRTSESFLDDLARGLVVRVYHDLKPSPSFSVVDTCIFRTIVSDGGDIYIASLAVNLPKLKVVDRNGVERQPEEWEIREHNERCYRDLVEMMAGRLAEIGVLDLRPGVIGVSYHLDAVYCRDLPVVKVIVITREDE